MQIVNQYSFAFLAGIIILVLAGFILRRGGINGLYLPLIASIIGFLLAFWLFSPKASTGSSDADSVEGTIGGGKAVLLEFQSPY